MTRLYGLLGGTFDPVHLAHVTMADRALEWLGLEQVTFMVTNTPPHKHAHHPVSGYHRLAMVALACTHDSRLVPSTLELEQAAPGYTVDSFPRFLRQQGLTAAEVLFIAGGDSLRDFHLWKASTELLAHYRFVFVTRRGIELGDPAYRMVQSGRITDLRTSRPEDLAQAIRTTTGSVLVDLETPDISSTQIRSMLQSKQNCTGLLPPAVNQYILKTGLYGGK